MTAGASLRPDDAEAMRSALDLAARALDTGDVPVGAVVLAPDGLPIAGAWNQREALADPTGHAEIVALREAAARLGRWRLEAATLVVTLEPCTMCAGAVGASRIGRLVFGAFDAKAGAVGSLWDVVRDRRLNHRPQVLSGVLEAECGALLLEFFSSQRGRSAGSPGPSEV